MYIKQEEYLPLAKDLMASFNREGTEIKTEK